MSQDLPYQNDFWVLDLVTGTEQHLQLTAKIPDPVPARGPLLIVMSPIFWSERGDRLIYWEADFNQKLAELVSLTIDTASMAITQVKMLGEAEPIQWIERGKLLLASGAAVLGLTGSQVKVIREATLPRKSEGRTARILHGGGTCPVPDARLYQVRHFRPIDGGDIGDVGFFSHLRACSKSVIARSAAKKQSQDTWLSQRDCFAPLVARNDRRGLF